MLKKFEYNKDFIEDNILEMWDGLSIQTILTNKNWYRDTNKWCQDFSDTIELPIMPVVGVFSALSPQCSFKQNKIFCEAYFTGFEKHTKTQIDKCNRITAFYGYLNQDWNNQKKQIHTYLGGRKTQSFFENILEPNDSQRVTLDRHAFKIAGFDIITLTNKQYDFMEECYQNCAKQVNMLPSELQAILWVYWRDVNNKSKFYD